MKHYTIDDFRAYLSTKDSLGDAMYYLTEENLNKAAYMDIEIEKIELVQTCGACPEQYDAFIDGKQVGYLRLRHGYFRVDFPDCGGETIYDANPDGDGIFTETERDHYLMEAKRAIIKKLKQIP